MVDMCVGSVSLQRVLNSKIAHRHMLCGVMVWHLHLHKQRMR